MRHDPARPTPRLEPPLSKSTGLLLARRQLVLAGLGSATGLRAQTARLAPAMSFPRDHGSHPQARTEWWYLTGQATAGSGAGAREFGFQVTFFRSRIEATQTMRSRFAAKQLIFAHAAITDVQGKKLWHDQRIARAGFEVAQAAENDMQIHLRDWSLQRQGRGYKAHVNAAEFAIGIECQETQPLLLQGEQGLSRKGPQPEQTSHYYSQPQLAVRGQLALHGPLPGGLPGQGPQRQRFEVTGKAWLDHEWSDALLDERAVGWDWIGMNLEDGSALTAFQLRDAQGRPLWGGGSYRSAPTATATVTANASSNPPYIFRRGEVIFRPQRYWKSPHSQANYPVQWLVQTPADFYTITALVDNQELDSRASTGTIYWEGLSELRDSNGKVVGRGYLEMTGYARALRL